MVTDASRATQTRQTMSLTSRIRTIEIGLAVHDTKPQLADLAIDFVHLWSDDRFLALHNEDMYFKWISRLTRAVAEVLRLAGVRCDAEVTASVLISATQHGGVASVEELLDVPSSAFMVAGRHAPRRHLEFAAAALLVLDNFVFTALERLSADASGPLTRSYNDVTVPGPRDAAPEQVYGLESQAVEQFTDSEE